MHTMVQTWNAARAVVGAILLVLVLGSTVLAGIGFSTPVILRTAAAGAGVELADVAGAGTNVSVVWQELAGGNGTLRLRTSTDGGQTFRTQRLVEDRHGSNGSTDICGAHAWVAHSFRLATDPEGTDGLIVQGLPLYVPGRTGELIVGSGGPQDVGATDFACVGSRRRAVAWVDRNWEGGWVVRVRFLPIDPDVKGEVPPDFERSFDGREGTSVAIAATATRAWLAWETIDERVRVKPFDIGPSPDFTVTPRPAVTLPDLGPSTGRVILGARGSKVVFAYGMRGHTYARVSTDSGATFGPRRRLIEGILGGDLLTTAVSADVRGSRAVVHAAEVGGIKDTVIVAHRFESTDDGGAWSDTVRDSDGFRMGAFTVIGGDTRLVEAWDQSASDADPKWVRFHREL